MLAAHDECNGEITYEGVNEEKYMSFYGMSSNKAQGKYNEKIPEYRASEGKVVKLKCKGPIKETIKDILGGLRSSHSYIGAINIKNFSKCCTFVRCTQTTNEIFSK